MTKANKPGYLLPQTPAPEDSICVCIPIPKDERHIQAFLGQIVELGYWYTWDRDASRTGRIVAAKWREIYQCISEEINCIMTTGCGCGGERTPTNQRYTPDGSLEVSYDNGETWENGDAFDPRFNSAVWTPLPGADGSDKRCAAANSIVTALKAEKDKASDILGLAGGVVDLVASVVIFVAGTGVGLVAAIILALIGAVLSAVASGGQAIFDDSFDDEFWAEVLCALYCNMADDASFTKAQWQAVIDTVKSLPPYPANDWTQGMIKSVGAVGLTNLARSNRAGALSCEGCECGCSNGCAGIPEAYQYSSENWTMHGAYTRFSVHTPPGQFDSFSLATTSAVLTLDEEKCITQVNVVVNNGCPGTGADIELFIDGISKGERTPLDKAPTDPSGCLDPSATWELPAGVSGTQITFVQTGTPCPGGYDNLLICTRIIVCP